MTPTENEWRIARRQGWHFTGDKKPRGMPAKKFKTKLGGLTLVEIAEKAGIGRTKAHYLMKHMSADRVIKHGKALRVDKQGNLIEE